MNSNPVNLVARYTAKTVRRNWLFRISFGIALLIAVSSFGNNSNLYTAGYLGFSSIPSYFAYQFPSAFSLFIVFPIVFLVEVLLQRGVKLDTTEVLLSRPVSNAAYRRGIMRGIVQPFIMLGFWLLLLTALAGILFTPFRFTCHYALFYYLTLVIPVVVFYTGLSLLVCSLIRNRALRLTLLLAAIALPLSYLQTTALALFNPFANILPALFSEITGFDRLGLFLLQRSSWLLLGIGLAAFSVCLVRRLPNRPSLRLMRGAIATLLTLSGLLCMFLYHADHLYTKRLRQQYADTYRCYEMLPRMRLDAQQIDFRQTGRLIRVESILSVTNPADARLEKSFLYLNPGLAVLELTDRQGKAISFTRHHQVIEMDYPIPPGQSREIRLLYEGHPCQKICYADIDDADYYRTPTDIKQVGISFRYLFTEKEYTLLTPEALWYPVCQPPLFVDRHDLPPRDFTRYTLYAEEPPGKMAVSSGRRIEVGENRVSFLPEQRLDGLFLCIGAFERFSLTADTLTIEAYIHKEHTHLVTGLDFVLDTLPQEIVRIKNDMEARIGLSYPFRHLRLIEVPLSLNTHVRVPVSESQFVQPAALFLPERAGREAESLDIHKKIARTNYEKNKGWSWVQDLSETDVARQYIDAFAKSTLSQPVRSYRHNGGNLFQSLFYRNQHFTARMKERKNPYQISSLFKERRFGLESADYPGLIHLLGAWFRLEADLADFPPVPGNEQQVSDYLADHTFREALYDPDFPHSARSYLFELKSADLINKILAEGYDEKEVLRFMTESYETHSFRQISFSDFNRRSVESLGLDWNPFLSSVYDDRGVPEFIVPEFTTKIIEPALWPADIQGAGLIRIEFEIYNPSETDGVVTLSFMQPVHYFIGKNSYQREGGKRFGKTNDELKDRHYLVPARSGKRVALNVSSHAPYVALLTPFSRNRPREIAIRLDFRAVARTRDTLQQVVSLTMADLARRENRIITIDNESPGFSAQTTANTGKIRRLGQPVSGDTYIRGTYQTASHGNWAQMTDYSFYGGVIRSIHLKRAGDGASASWTATIPESGEYEIEVYMPYRLRPTYEDGEKNRKGKAEYLVKGDPKTSPIRQFYRIGEEEISLRIGAKDGWNSLGRFTLAPGEHRVVLTDKGFDNQVIYADAVRWVKVSDRSL